MEWSEEEQKRLCGALMKRCPDFGSRGSLGDIVAKEIGSLAVQLVVKRGGTMTVGQKDCVRVARNFVTAHAEPSPMAPGNVRGLLDIIVDMDARIAVLKEKLAEQEGASILDKNAIRLQRERAEEAEKERDHYKTSWEVYRISALIQRDESSAALADARATIARLIAERDDLRLRLAALEVAGAKLSEHVDKTAGGEPEAAPASCKPEDMDLTCIACDQCTLHRWQPSPDAGPGWRCSECSALSAAGRYPCAPTCTHDDAAKPGHPKRVKEPSEAVPPDDDGSTPAAEAYDIGVEAMRTACLKAVRAKLKEFGFDKCVGTNNPSPLAEGLEAAIKGAVP